MEYCILLFDISRGVVLNNYDNVCSQMKESKSDRNKSECLRTKGQRGINDGIV